MCETAQYLIQRKSSLNYSLSFPTKPAGPVFCPSRHTLLSTPSSWEPPHFLWKSHLASVALVGLKLRHFILCALAPK